MPLTHEPPSLLYFDDEADAALRLADAAGMEPAAIDRHRFPDGELKLRRKSVV